MSISFLQEDPHEFLHRWVLDFLRQYGKINLEIYTTPVLRCRARGPERGFCIFGGILKTNVYVDGFNLYYGCLRGTPNKWLNLSKLCSILLPKNKINKIKYFTALVRPRPTNPGQQLRQLSYLRALKTDPLITIFYGHYLSHKVWMPTAASWDKPTLKYVQVVKTEEKGSDVNLATHLLFDACKNDFEVAVVISNDSDLQAPIKIVKNDLKKKVGIINPHPRPSKALMAVATFFHSIRPSVLGKCQFPNSMSDKKGIFYKPSTW